jgi:hypothetical protein
VLVVFVVAVSVVVAVAVSIWIGGAALLLVNCVPNKLVDERSCACLLQVNPFATPPTQQSGVVEWVPTAVLMSRSKNISIR